MVWSNWSGLVKCQPKRIERPTSEQDLVALVRSCVAKGGVLRPVGAGHSFTPLVQSDQVLVDLDNMSGLVHVDREGLRAQVRAGTNLKQLGQMLFEQGLAQENLGDIDVQSIAGAVSTGTHGTGPRFGVIATQITSLTLVNGLGEVVSCSAEDKPDLFAAARVSLGSLGIISEIGLKLTPAYKLKYISRRALLSETLANLEGYAEGHRNFEFYWFPHTDRVQLKLIDKTQEPNSGLGLGKKLNDLLLENAAFWGLSQLCRWVPGTCKPVAKLCAAVVGQGSRVDQSHRIFATRRMVRFQEMEYNLPRKHLEEVMRKVYALVERRGYRVHFPLECRFVASDDIWLSPAHGRDSAYVAVHMLKGMPYDTYFRELQEIFLAYDGRPHWGKWHDQGPKFFAASYPRWHEFLALREKMDPKRVFLNPYLKDLFGL